MAQLDKELRLDSTFAGSVPSASGEGGRGGGVSVRPGLETQRWSKAPNDSGIKSG